MKPSSNQTNMKNLNKGTNGVNRQASQVHGNRGKQLAQQGPKAAPKGRAK